VLILIVALPGVWPIADGTSVTAASHREQQLQRPVQRRRLDGHDPRAQPAKDGDPVADMGADIEHEVVRPDELRI
jgi:hypothetical protein